jgi:hypothetical protein
MRPTTTSKHIRSRFDSRMEQLQGATVPSNERTTRLGVFVGMLTASILAIGFRDTCQAQEWRGISVTLNSIRIHDEDDPLSSDEPYLIFIRVRGRVVGPEDARRLDANSIEVSLAMNGHNNLGRSKDNWTKERRTFEIPSSIPRIVQDIVPGNEAGWFVAGLLMHMEEDAWSPRIARELGENTRSALEREVRRFANPSVRLDTRALMREILGGVAISVFESSFTRALVSGVDPDDFGGLQVAGAVSLGNGVVVTFSGDPSILDNFLAGGTPPPGGQILAGRRTSQDISLTFPGGIRPKLPGNARFKGRHTINATIETWEQRF